MICNKKDSRMMHRLSCLFIFTLMITANADANIYFVSKKGSVVKMTLVIEFPFKTFEYAFND